MTAPSTSTGNHRDVALERRGELDAHIVFVVSSRRLRHCRGDSPARADDGEQHVAGRDLNVELLAKSMRFHGIDIHEQLLARVFAAK